MLRKISFIVSLSCITLLLAAQPDKEADLKAVFIYNFTQYIDWDSTKLKDNFVIGVLGSSPVTIALNEIARTNTVKDRPILVEVYNRPEDIGNCQVLFIPHKMAPSLAAALERVDKGVLTVSEEQRYPREGTAFNFVIVSNKLKFQANLKALSAAGLKASSQLLKLAIIIN